ncbi:MAG: 3-hydroxyacyl-CoA dehydrogenase NAD-binding domain-containing protein, partial [Burkholderia contaminans]
MSAAELTRVHVLGAGRMGQGIALVFAFAGLDVTLIDFKRRDAVGRRAFDDRTRD